MQGVIAEAKCNRLRAKLDIFLLHLPVKMNLLVLGVNKTTRVMGGQQGVGGVPGGVPR